jgi:hypothetical protein
MAKDPNSSDNGNTPNQIGDFGLSRLAEIAAESRPSAEERELRRRAKVAQKGIDIYNSLGDVARQYPPIQSLHKRNINTLSVAQPRIRIAVETRQQRLTGQAINAISGEFSETSINGTLGRLANSLEAQHGALSMMNTPYNDLVGEQRSRQARLQELGESNRALASKVIGRQGINQGVYGSIQANTREAQGIMNELGTIGAALGQQKGLGLDPKSRTSALMQDVTKAQGVSEGSGAYNAAQELIKAFERLSEVTDVTSKEFKDLQKTTDEARKKFANSGGNGDGNAMARLGMAAGGFNTAAGAVQTIMVNQRLAQAQNAAGLADIENQKYQTYKAAAGGDIASLMQLSQFTGAEGFGGEVGTAAKVAVRAQQVAGYAQLAQGVLQLANPTEGAMDTGAAGVNNSLSGLVTSSIAEADANRQVSENQARIAATQARLNVSRAVNAVGAEQVQGFRDFAVGMGTAAIGMGSRGEEFLNTSISDSSLNRMASARISPEQMAQMSQMGVASMGSMFNQNQVFTARENEQRGLGTMQENMQRMGALASAGSNNPASSLGAITEAAVAKGLDSSKALNMVVEHTASMAASSAGRAIGIDTTAAAATLLMSGINKDTPNREAAIEHAADVQGIARGISTNIGANYAGMVSTARTQKALGIGGIQAVAAESIDTETLMSINEEKDPKKKIRRLQELGVNLEGNRDVNKAVSAMVDNRQTKLLEAGGKGLLFNNRGALQKRVNAAKSIDELSGTDVTELGDIARLSGMSGGAKDEFNVLKGVKAQVAKESAGPANVNDGSKLASLDKLRTAGFEQLSTAASTAASNLGGASKAISTLTTAIESLSKEMPSIEKNATTAAGKAAAGDKGMNVNVTQFNAAIDKLDKVLSNVLAKSSLGAGSGADRQRTKAPGP